MQEQKTILGVPEITGTTRQEIVVGIPVVEMKLQSWKINIPEFTLKNITVETQKTKDRAAELQAREKNANVALSEAMQGEIKQASAENISAVFTCQSADLNESKASALADIDANINTIKASIDNAVKFGATAFRDSMQKALDDMIVARERTLASFIESENKLNEQKKIEMEKIINSKV